MTFSELLNLNGQGEPWVCRLLDRHMCGLGTSELVSELMGGDRGFILPLSGGRITVQGPDFHTDF